MVRRPDTESDKSSQTIDERPVKVKPEKRATDRRDGYDGDEQDEQDVEERVQEGEFIDGVREDDDDELNEDDEGEEGEGTSSMVNKRARLNDEGESVKIMGERSSTRRPARPAILSRDTDGYVAGSIVRVKLHNFLTYDDVEFCPGPYLNMVLGPNGTGKSSIACAICLGLNWPPSVLGRASKLSAFVKLGKRDGFIEIELKGPIGEPNLVIRRLLTTSMSTQQTFTLNGVQTPGKEISARVEGLGIQVNNLCSFLPQDKVSEFAQLSPQQLLRATQNAAGDEQLITWHNILIETGTKLKAESSGCAFERKELENLEQRNATLEKEVSAYKTRRRIEKEIELLELILPCKEYLDARKEYEVLKQRREELHQKAQALKDRSKPVLEFRNKMARNKDEANTEREKCRATAKRKFDSLKSLWKKSEDLQTDSDRVTDDLTALKNQERKRRNVIQSLKDDIHKLEHEIAHPPLVEDMETIAADFRANEQERNDAEMNKHVLEGAIHPFVDEAARQDVQLKRVTDDLKKLDSASHRKLEAFSNWDRGAGAVVAWLRQNKQRFKMDVIEPAALSVDVNDGRFAAAVEAAFSAMQLKTFVFLCDEDRKLFNHLIIDTKEGMGRQVKVATWYRPHRPDNMIPPPMNPEELRQQGFDAYGIDLVTYPEGMLWFLQEEIKLHRFAIGLDSSKINMQSAMELVSRVLPSGKGGSGNFIAGNVLSQVARSRYGQRKPFNNTRDITAARSFRSAPVDQEKKRAVETAIAQANQLKEEAEREIAKISHQIKEADTHLHAVLANRNTIENRRKAVNDILRKLHTMELRLGDKRRALQKEENAPSMEEKRAELRMKGFEYARKRLAIAKQLKDSTKSSIEDSHKAAICGLQFLQIGANIDALEELMKTHDTEYQTAMLNYNAITQEYNDMKASTKAKLVASRKKLAEIDEELRQTFMEKDESGEMDAMSVDNIQQDLANLKAQLELNLATNAGVIEIYEKRQREIEQRTRVLQNKEKKKADLEHRLQKTRGKWLPALQELVENINEKFSAAFDRVNCAGEIKIAEHADDYSAWAIDILVKFRNSENLQLLTGQRQSGGERALTTIMYLMSLAELARSPFSLVDEINQGMDAQYERAVHNSLVEVTCRVDSGQYFLITPKLLTDLKYHERMKVLCVSNGEWLPDEQLGGNMMRMIDSYLAHRGRAQ